MQRLATFALALALVALGSCCREKQELKDDATRFIEKFDPEYQALLARIQDWTTEQKLHGQRLALEKHRFIEWRKREWWNLDRELSNFIYYNWREIEQLTKAVARHYGYSIENFPVLTDDILLFFHQADVEWRYLVQDVCIFYEYRQREVYPLQDELRRFYQAADWEVANLEVDVRQFLEWRDREYDRMVQNGLDWWSLQGENVEKLKQEVLRFQSNHLISGRLLVADFKNFLRRANWEVPRLIDGVWQFVQWREREYDRYIKDLLRWRDAREADLRYLDLAVKRWHLNSLRDTPLLIAEINRYFDWLDREGRPLTEDVKRFWRENIALGELAVADLRRYCEMIDEDAAELDVSMQRFVAYGAEEFDGLKKAVRRFATCAHDPAFGDPVIPFQGDLPVKVFQDHTVPESRVGNTDL